MTGYNTYIGARYVPIFGGEWDNKKSYEPLVIVSYQGNSYTSKIFVPANTDISDERFWALTGNYNAQVEYYRQETERLENDVNTLRENLSYLQSYVTPQMYGAKGDGTTDDTNAIKEALKSGKNVYFPKTTNGYRITSYLVFEHVTIEMENGAYIKKDYDDVGVFCIGGANATTLINFKIVGYGNGKNTDGIKTGGHGIVVIGNKVVFSNVVSSNHRGNGVLFIADSVDNSGFNGYNLSSYSCNMNKTVIDYLYSSNNDGCGVFIRGTQDDISVWRANIYTQYNRKNGLYISNETIFRDNIMYVYSENDGLNNTDNDHSVYIGKSKNSQFTIYAEGQNNKNAKEIFIDTDTTGMVDSLRANRDINNGNMYYNTNGIPTFIIRGSTADDFSVVKGNTKYIIPVSRIISSARYDFDVISDNDKTYFKRITESGLMECAIDKNDKTGTIKKDRIIESVGTNLIECKYISGGNVNKKTNVSTGDVIYTKLIKGYSNGEYRAAGKIEYVVTNVGAGKLACDIVFYNANNVNSYTESFRIKSDGTVNIKGLIGETERQLYVSPNGNIIAK